LNEVPGRLYVHQEYIGFSVRGKTIIWEGINIEGGYTKPIKPSVTAKTNRLVIRLNKGKSDLPKIDGLILIKGGLSNTDYSEYRDMVENWVVYEEKLN
jgi:hypothetical protein